MASKLGLLPKDILERLKRLPERIARVEGILALWLFGSFARGEATPISDVDLAYLSNQDLEGEALEAFEGCLYRVISSTLGTDEISLVDMRRAPLFLRWRVLVEGKLLLCRDEGAVARLAEEVYNRAPDIRWLRAYGNAVFLEVSKMSDRTVDKERITEFLRLVGQDLQVLREKAKVPLEVYLGSRDLQSIVERRLQTAIESAINIGNHIIARLGLRAPQDYADVFQILKDAGVISADVASRMMDMARFRNLLVHVYWELDHKRVHETLERRIRTLEDFAESIARWLEKAPG
ncbi:type VII toxin-antitoxin system HepT family RNase toxin [Candidatus Bipolaricaulota sp. J31]